MRNDHKRDTRESAIKHIDQATSELTQAADYLSDLFGDTTSPTMRIDCLDAMKKLEEAARSLDGISSRVSRGLLG